MNDLETLTDKEKDELLLRDLSKSKLGLTPITVLNNMIDGRENVDLKSDIANPKNLTLLKTMGKVYGSYGYDLAEGYIEYFITHYLRYRISKNRESRKELTEVLSSQVALEKQKLINEAESSFK